jgi:hypothetical protein
MKNDGTSSVPVQAVTTQVVICDPRVQSRVQRHIDDRTASFSVFELVGKPGSAAWMPRKLFITPTSVALKCFASATTPASFTSHRLTPETHISLKENDGWNRSILTIQAGLVLHLSNENFLKRDTLVMLLRHWM